MLLISQQHAADTAYHNSLVELGKRLLACAKEGDTEVSNHAYAHVDVLLCPLL